MCRQRFRGLVATLLLLFANLITPSRADDQAISRPIQEEMWALPLPLPMFAYLVRPVGDGPFPLVIMNHGVSLDPEDRSFFPLVEFRDAAKWFAKRGYLVVAPVGTGYGASAIDIPEHGLYGPFFSKVGKCSNPNFRSPGFAVAQVDLWIIDYMAAEKRIIPTGVIVVGQSAGGWASIALSSLNPPQVKAIIIFAAGRGGRVDGQPNNNCAPHKLVEATAEFGRTSRVPMLWIYIENDTFFGPALSKRMHEAFTAAGGKAEYHLVPPFGSDGHFFIGSPDAIPIWSPLVTKFLDEQGYEQPEAWRRNHGRAASHRNAASSAIAQSSASRRFCWRRSRALRPASQPLRNGDRNCAPRAARGKGHHLWRLAETLLQARRRKDALPDLDNRHVCNRSNGGSSGYHRA